MKEDNDIRIFRIVGLMIQRITRMTTKYQKEIFNKCEFSEDANNDARVALMGFLKAELISIYFQYCCIKEQYFQTNKKLNYIRVPLGVEVLSNDEILKILISSLRQSVRVSIFTLLESGNRFIGDSSGFNKHRKTFDLTLNSGYEILRYYRNAMHNNGLFLPDNRKDFNAEYREFHVEFKYGTTMNGNYKLDFWILRDSITLYKLIALDNLISDPGIKLINPLYNIDTYKKTRYNTAQTTPAFGRARSGLPLGGIIKTHY